tara:strand:+ start:245 stop:463 length:219 start_codon:yes stop_codon:yes gene_type:complete
MYATTAELNKSTGKKNPSTVTNFLSIYTIANSKNYRGGVVSLIAKKPGIYLTGTNPPRKTHSQKISQLNPFN